MKKESTANKWLQEVQHILYIDPADTLATIRERLDHTTYQQIALVFPPQTAMRSHVAWRLLQKRTQELAKEVFIVSPDPQIRAIARTLKFKVAASLPMPSA